MARKDVGKKMAVRRKGLCYREQQFSTLSINGRHVDLLSAAQHPPIRPPCTLLLVLKSCIDEKSPKAPTSIPAFSLLRESVLALNLTISIHLMRLSTNRLS